MELGQKTPKRRKKLPTRTKLLWCAVIAIITYTTASVILQFVCQTEVSTSLTYSWYGFWSFELWNLSRITINKSKNGYYDKTEIANSDTEE